MKTHPFIVGAIAGGLLGVSGLAVYTAFSVQQSGSTFSGLESTSQLMSAAIITGAAVWLIARLIG